MEKIVGVGCRFWVGRLKDWNYVFWEKIGNSGTQRLKPNPPRVKKILALNVGQVPGGIYKAFSFSIKPQSCVLHFFKELVITVGDHQIL